LDEETVSECPLKMFRRGLVKKRESWFRRHKESLRAFCADTSFQAIWGTMFGVIANMIFPMALTSFLRDVLKLDVVVPPLTWGQFIAISCFGWLCVLLFSRPQGIILDMWRKLWHVSRRLT
jgi:hypothetical protein